ncbi:MAG: glycosyltransferase [Hyphomicrobiaceae bacterium]
MQVPMTVSGLPHVQLLWVEGPLSAVERLSLSSYLANGHPVHLYHYGAVTGVPKGVMLLDAREIVPEARLTQARGVWGIFSDLFRYALLLKRGGIWSDTDVVLLKALDFANARTRFFATELQPSRDGVNTDVGATGCVMKSEPGSRIMSECFERVNRLKWTRKTWGTTGPVLVTTMINDMGLGDDTVPPSTFCPVPWWNFQDVLTDTGLLLGNAYGIHLYNECWMRERLEKNASYRLKRRYLV